MSYLSSFKKGLARILPDEILYPLTKDKFARKYIKSHLTVKEFFEILNSRNIDYCVLRWFDDLLNIPKDEDIDILIDDRHLEKFSDLISNRTNGIKCDIYSTTGLKGYDYMNLPYYPPKLGRQILKNTIFSNEKIRIPNSEFHFRSLAFHALYHKGYNSGLRSSKFPEKVKTNPENDYESTLNELKVKLGVNIESLTLENLDSYLEQNDWKPYLDTLEKFSKNNQWLKDYFFTSNEVCKPKQNGLAVFILREKGEGFIDNVLKIIDFEGFEILKVIPINQSNSDEFTERIRGGNWGKGPFSISGGKPKYLIICTDVFPLEVPSKLKNEHTGLSNYRVYKTKTKVRNAFNENQAKSNHCNILHSSDNAIQALDYIDPLGSELKNSILNELKECYNYVNNHGYFITKQLPSLTRRAAVYLIEINNENFVLKVFRKDKLKFFKREVDARSVFGDNVTQIAPIVEKGKNYFLLPYYDNHYQPMFYKLSIFFEMRNIILEFQKKGYEFIDFSPENIIRISKQDFVLIDFEFFQKVKFEEQCLETNLAWNRPNKKLTLDIPNNYFNPYKFWKIRFLIPKFIAHSDMKLLINLSRILTLLDIKNWVYIVVFYFKRKKRIN